MRDGVTFSLKGSWNTTDIFEQESLKCDLNCNSDTELCAAVNAATGSEPNKPTVLTDDQRLTLPITREEWYRLEAILD